MCANYTIPLASDSLGSPIEASPWCECLMRDPVLQEGPVKNRLRQLEKQRGYSGVCTGSSLQVIIYNILDWPATSIHQMVSLNGALASTPCEWIYIYLN